MVELDNAYDPTEFVSGANLFSSGNLLRHETRRVARDSGFAGSLT